MGCVYRDKRSARRSWAIRYEDVDGRVRKERTGAAGKRLALRILAHRENAVERARLLGLASLAELNERKPSVYLGDFAQEFLLHAEAQCRKTTVKRYRGILANNVLPRLGGMKLEEVNPGHVQKYSDERLKEGAAPATVQQELAVLSGLFREATKHELVHRNPVRLVRKPRVDNKIVRYLDRNEERRLLAAASEPLRSAILVAIHSGLRHGEQIQLPWSDVWFEERLLVVRNTKSKRDRIVPMSRTLHETLRRLPRRLPDSPYVFTNPETGTKYDRFNNTSWRKTLKRAGIQNFRWHDLRHSFGSRLAQAGVAIQVIAQLMGHSSLSVTMRYAHLAPSNLKAAIRTLDEPPQLVEPGRRSAHRSTHGARRPERELASPLEDGIMAVVTKPCPVSSVGRAADS